MEIAERLQKLRRKAGYSQEQTAELLGISRQAVSKCSASLRSSRVLHWLRSFLSLHWDLSRNIFYREELIIRMKKKWKRLFLLTLTLVMPFLSGCIYSHNYDKNGNEMDQVQVEEAIENTIENIKDVPFGVNAR